MNDVMQRNYDAFDWYWLRGNALTVYSSKRDQEVRVDDAEYQAWLESGGIPTPYPRDTEGNESALELWQVLAPYGLGALGNKVGSDFVERDGEIWKIRFTKKEFMLWCGLMRGCQ